MRMTLAVIAAVLCWDGRLAAESDTTEPEVVQTWKFEKDTAGWKAVTQVGLDARRGVLTVHGTGPDPHFMTDVAGPAGWKLLRIHVRSRQALNGQIFWATDNSGGFSEARSAHFQTGATQGGFRKIDVFFQAEKDVTQLRIDPHNGTCRIEIRSIALLNAAPPAPQAPPADSIRLPEGFRAELIYSVPDDQGSWVSLTVDPQGRLITSDQYGGLYRIELPAVSGQKLLVEKIDVDLGMAQGMCWAFNSLYVMVNGPGAGLYRVRDTDGDDQLDEVKLLRAIRGSSEHGPHAVIPAPDGKSLLICGGNHTELPDPETSRVPRVWDEDQLLPRMWDAGGHAVGKLAPGGWIARTDPDGDLFTYDADMEWDIGTPWYRPTRVNHVVSGAEFGWRSGTGKFPEYYPDSLGSVVDIGPGSPTGIVFGSGAKFPAKYQTALFICDWSYGVLYAVHMQPDGAGYIGQAERFASGTPLQLTDIVINPEDQAMYFTIGGRRTQSGLYRVTYIGGESTAPPPHVTRPPHPDVLLRKQLEQLQVQRKKTSEQVSLIIDALGSQDQTVRYAAFVALQFCEISQWPPLSPQQKTPDRVVRMSMARARLASQWPAETRTDRRLQASMRQLLSELVELDWDQLNQRQKLELLRAVSLTFIRLAPPDESTRDVVLKFLNHRYPAKASRVNRELSQLLIYLDAPNVIPRTLTLMEKAPTQEEQMQLALWLRTARKDWSLDNHRRYFSWFNKAAAHRGGHSLQGFLGNIRKEAIARLTEVEQKQLAEILSVKPDPAKVSLIESRKMVRKWTVDELLPAVQTRRNGRSFENGRNMFAQGACFRCHRFAGEGGIVGPVLDSVGKRFNDRNLLESILEPDRVISDQYQATTFVLESGKAVTGRIANLSGKNYLVSQNMLDPGRLTVVSRDEIEEMIPSKLSMMPRGLIDTMTAEEILDLLAYLRSGGNPEDDVFR